MNAASVVRENHRWWGHSLSGCLWLLAPKFWEAWSGPIPWHNDVTSGCERARTTFVKLSEQIFTACQWSCWKLLFSLRFVWPWGWVSLIPCPFQGRVSLVPDPLWKGWWVCPEVGTPQPLTPGGSHHTYGRHASSSHPTWMLSCGTLLWV